MERYSNERVAVNASTRRERRVDATRARILDAAITRFLDDGYAATTVEAIAQDAGVAVQTIYNVFGSKSRGRDAA